MKRVPFCPIPLKRAKTISRRLNFWGSSLSKAFPTLNINLKQSGFDLNSPEYTSIAIFSALFMGLAVFFPFLFFSLLITDAIKGFMTSMLVGFLFFSFSFLYIQKYPRLIVNRKVRDIEANLMPALKHMFVQIKSHLVSAPTIVVD